MRGPSSVPGEADRQTPTSRNSLRRATRPTDLPRAATRARGCSARRGRSAQSQPRAAASQRASSISSSSPAGSPSRYSSEKTRPACRPSAHDADTHSGPPRARPQRSGDARFLAHLAGGRLLRPRLHRDGTSAIRAPGCRRHRVFGERSRPPRRRAGRRRPPSARVSLGGTWHESCGGRSGSALCTNTTQTANRLRSSRSGRVELLSR